MHRIVSTAGRSSNTAADAPVTPRPQSAIYNPWPDTPHPQRDSSIQGSRRAGRPPNGSGLHNWPRETRPLPPWLTTLDLSRKHKRPEALVELPPSLRTSGVGPDYMANWAALVTPKINRLTPRTETDVPDTGRHTDLPASLSGEALVHSPLAALTRPVLPGAFKHFTAENTDALLTNLKSGSADLASLSRTSAGFQKQLQNKADTDKKLHHSPENAAA